MSNELELRSDSIHNAAICFVIVAGISAAAKHYAEEKKGFDKPSAFICTIGGVSISSALIFALFSKERQINIASRDGFLYGFAASAIGTALTETKTVAKCAFWAGSVVVDAISTVGNGVGNAISRGLANSRG